MTVRPLQVFLFLLAMQVALVGAAQAQPYVRFDVPDSLLSGAIRASGRGFEAAWNALLVAELRAALARDHSAASLGTLQARIAAAEPAALGSTIAHDALELRKRWGPNEQRLRLSAWEAESLGVEANGERRFADADRRDRQALDLYRRLNEKRRVAWLLGGVAMNAFLAADFATADTFYLQALAARTALGDQRMIGASLNSVGATRLMLGRPAEAYPYLLQARAVREHLGDRAALGATLNGLATTQAYLGYGDSARVTYTLALQHSGAAGDSEGVSNILYNFAYLQLNLGESTESMRSAERGLAIAESDNDAVDQAQFRERLGAALAFEGRFAEAGEHLDRALSGSLAAGDTPTEMDVRTQIGNLGIQLQDPRAARPPLERAVFIADSLHRSRDASAALNNLAIVCMLEGDSSEARSVAMRAAQFGAAGQDSFLLHSATVTLGQLAVNSKDYLGAEALFTRARAALAQPPLALAISDEINLAIAVENLGRLEEARAGFERAQRTASNAGAYELLWPAMLGLGDVAERRGRYAEALSWDRSAATLIDTLRARQGSQSTSIVLLSRRLFAFDALIHLLGKLAPQFPDSGYDAEAFDWAERVRARAFLDLLNARGVAGRRITPVSLDAARAALPSDHAALLEYSLGDSSSSLWVVTRNSWLRLSLPPAPVLRPRAEMLRRALGDPDAADSRSARGAARALYRLLIEPAEPALIGVDQLIVSPDGALARIPFEALLAAEAPPDAPVPANAYLIERYQVSYTPSATAFSAAKASPPTGPTPPRGGTRTSPPPAGATTVVAIGAPEFGTQPPRGALRALEPLPHTIEELTSLREIAGASRCEVVSGRAATRDTLLALAARPGAEVLHVATHGVANEAMPERSGLWLSASADSVPPDFVSLDDLLALRLSARLVTLSACETGAGRLERGEGVVGLARALMAAGAQSVVVSLWSVNDQSTASLMRAFYSPLLIGGESRAQSLAEAKRALLRSSDTRSPFHWAPFVLIGAPGTLN